MAEVVTEKGYAATSVADVLKLAGVSRQSFYQLFSSKQDCFLATYDRAAERLVARVFEALGPGGLDDGPDDPSPPLKRYERGFNAYLEALRAEWSYTRLFLVEVFAAGPAAVARRVEGQDFLVQTHADVLGAATPEALLACRMVVAAGASLVSNAAAADRPDRLADIGREIVEYVRTLWEAGVFTAPVDA
ncbi:TetR/AcrR family transcriptional regulator [Actinomadura sp. PM05-2]|uniref:TetR/AcrR family transcriptional regulator n=2 Tax=Actinomadura parmotrematis TaxID=2864039 RepID=A0ABS7FZ13_9ACTN|nr:TetR/AcrR family transcriptional regulator [Actinomadura parmotrematis]